ncbi:MAG: hypothetical protein WC889_09000 [Myxococcota bacterium]|jgi:hypothetical protein
MPEMRFVLPLATLPQAFSLIESLKDDQFDALVRLIASPRSFSPPEADISGLANELEITAKDVEALLGALHFLYERLSELPLVDGSRDAAITELAREIKDDISPTSPLPSRLSKLLLRSEAHDHFKKIFRLERGFLPSAISFESLVDMRPDFNDDLSEIRGYIPVISYNVRTNSSNPQLRSLTINIPVDKVDDFIKSVERLKAKILQVGGKLGL